MNKKSALEQALLESDNILRVVTENAKDMLLNQMKPAISQSITEGLEDLKSKDDEEVVEPVGGGDETSVETPENGDEPIVSDEPAIDAAPEASTEPESGLEPAIGGDDSSSVEVVPAMDSTSGPVDGDTMDLTGASDDEVLSVWKKMGDNAEIQVVKNGDDSVSVTTPQGDEFMIKLNENEELAIAEEFAALEAAFPSIGEPQAAPQDDKYSFLDGINGGQPSAEPKVYEIVMEDEVPVEETTITETPTITEEPLEEVARTHADGRNMTRKPESFEKYAASRMRPAMNESSEQGEKGLLTEAEILKSENTRLITEAETLKSEVAKLIAEQDEYKEALRKMSGNLEGVALFNSKLAYINKLFCENATTTNEKKVILERFDAEKSQKDVQALFKTIEAEMKEKTITESVETVIGNTVNGNTGETLLESVSPEKQVLNEKVERIKAIMNYNPSGK